MDDSRQIEQVRLFVNRYGKIGLFSTGAKIVDFSDDLYNVTGSTEDPKEVREYKGLAWKKLLIRLLDLEDASCYVTNEAPDGESSHPNFGVGGHMTPKSTGKVPDGGITYLMPLCKWHNSTGRDGTAFEHSETRMLQLSGFMEGDSAVTFAMRLPSDEQFSLLHYDRANGTWEFSKLSREKALGFNAQPLSTLVDVAKPAQDYALFERKGDRYFVVDTNL